MENNEKSKKVFTNIWSNVYKIIGGETKFKDKFEFIEGTQETSRRNDNKITIEFVNFNGLGISGDHIDGYIYGQTGYLDGKPKLVRLMKVEECDKRLYSDLIHNYAHEMVHVASHHLNSTSDNNRIGLMSNNMISETTADMIADIGLRTFNPEFSNGMTINQMIKTPYQKWAIHSANNVSGYAKCVPLLQLLILSFQNENINYLDLYNKYKAGICGNIKTNSDLQINDFLYGIIYDYSHIKNVWNKFMGNKLPFDDFSRKCDRLYEKRGPDFNNQEAFEIMQHIADFANIKSRYNLENGLITPQTNESLRSDFNTLWNQVINTYNLFPNRTERSGPSFDD